MINDKLIDKEKFIIDEYNNSKDKTYSTEYVNRFCKKLWEGNFTSGSINVPNLSNYGVIIVIVGGAFCFGSLSYGLGGAGAYGGYGRSLYTYRFGVNGNTLSINNIDKGGSDGSNNVPVTAIYGLF